MRENVPTFQVKAKNGPFKYKITRDGRKYPDGCHLVFKCPVCGKENVHGGHYKNKGAADGHRVSHCGCWPDGYNLEEV